MTQWQDIPGEDLDHLPGRVWVKVEGWKDHSGATWGRVHYDIVYTRRSPDTWHIRKEDLDRVKRDGDMDGIESVQWKPITYPVE